MGWSDRLFSNNCNFKAIAESGQCFRMRLIGDKYWLVSNGKLAYGWNEGDNAFLGCNEEDYSYWRQYFDLDTDYTDLGEKLKEEGNHEFITKSVDFSKGLRLLRQEPFETLISFIISQRKNIPAISKCVEALCHMYGKPLEGTVFYSFPTAEELMDKDMSAIPGIGYRDMYVHDAVCRVNSYLKLNDLAFRRYSDAVEQLKVIYGVGDKVASCVCLYGLGFRNAFPIDVWMQRIINEDFNGRFPYDKISGNLGILQLFMFYYKRKGLV